jgi:hypothetical protein
MDLICVLKRRGISKKIAQQNIIGASFKNFWRENSFQFEKSSIHYYLFQLTLISPNKKLTWPTTFSLMYSLWPACSPPAAFCSPFSDIFGSQEESGCEEKSENQKS